MNPTERGQFAFVPVLLESGAAAVVAEPLTRAPQLSRFDQGRLVFELPPGKGLEEAQALADLLVHQVAAIGFMG